MKSVFFSAVLLLAFWNATSQNVAITNDGSAPDPKAMLDIKSNSKGLLLPRMTQQDRGNITGNVPLGLVVFQTDGDRGFYYNASALSNFPNWKKIVTGDETFWQYASPNYLYYSGGANVGIGTTTPNENLHVDSTIKVGKNQPLPGNSLRKNIIKFGDGAYVTIGEEQNDDRLHIRYGDLIFQKSNGSAGSGNIGINTETPTASLDLNGTLRLRGNGASIGKVLVSDASGNASWGTVPSGGLTLPYLGTSSTGPGDQFAIFNQSGNHSAGYFENSVAGSYSPALEGKYATGVGIGVRGEAQSSNSASPMAVQAFLNGNGTNGYGLYASANNATAIAGVTQSGTGVSGTASGVGGIGGYFSGNPGSKALQTNGSIQLRNIGEGTNKVLTSDANGNASWRGMERPAMEYAVATIVIIPSNGTPAALGFSDQNYNNGFTTTVVNGITRFIIPSDGVYQINVSVLMAFIGTVSADCQIRLVIRPVGTNSTVLRAQHYFLPNTNGRKTSEGLSKLISLSQGDQFWIEILFNGSSDLAVYGETGTSTSSSTLSCFKVSD